MLRVICLIQWLAFRDDGKYSVADYAKIVSERVSKNREVSSWNPFEQGLTIKRRQSFITKLFQGVMKGVAYLHDHDRLHQSLGPFSVVLKYGTIKHLIGSRFFIWLIPFTLTFKCFLYDCSTISEKEGSYLIPRLRDLAFSVNVR